MSDGPEPVSWVLGRGGMLGSALARCLLGSEHRPTQPLAWGSAGALRAQLRANVAQLAELSRERQAPWQVCWCAGASVVGSSEGELQAEVETLRELLRALAEQSWLRRSRGTFLLVSSAGGVYAGVEGGRISESRAPAPISAYGRAKLEQERVLAASAPQFEQLATLTARVSNLYGPQQRLDKQQGLISHLARAVVLGKPAHIYVPLDTTRDYLFVDDAARVLASGLRRLHAAPEVSHRLKICAAERDTSIACLLGIFRSIAKRRLRVVAGIHAASLLQPRHLSFCSEVWPETKRLHQTELVAGVSLVYRHLLRSFLAGRFFA